MKEREFDRQPFVAKIRQIFGNPEPPSVITQQPYNNFHDQDFKAIANTPWQNIAAKDCWTYLHDLAYNRDLQQELFDYAFPACLLIWRDGLMLRVEQPSHTFDFYHAISTGRIFERMMSAERRVEVWRWMTDAYCSAASTIQADEIMSVRGRNDRLHFMVWTFNGLGQTAPILGAVLDWLSEAPSVGKARWWLVFSAGLCYPENGVPWIAPYSREGDGGCVYLLETNTSILDKGFLTENVAACRDRLSLPSVNAALQHAVTCLPKEEAHMASACLARLVQHPHVIQCKLDWYLTNLDQPALGGVQDEPPFFATKSCF